MNDFIYIFFKNKKKLINSQKLLDDKLNSIQLRYEEKKI